MLPESAKKLREPLAALLLGAAVLYLIVTCAQLFKDSGSIDDRALYLQDRFVNPAWVLVVVLAALLVTLAGESTARARLIVIAALSVLALMAVLGIVTWLVGLGADIDLGFDRGKIAMSFLTIAGLSVLAAGAGLTFLLYRTLPRPVRPHAPLQQWGDQQQWAGQQQQWVGQPQWGAQPQWGVQPPMQQPPVPGQAWGQTPPPAAWGANSLQQPPPPQSWGAPGVPTSGEHPAPATPQPETTAEWRGTMQPDGGRAGGSTAAPTPQRPGDRPEDRPGDHSEDRPEDGAADDYRPGAWQPPS